MFRADCLTRGSAGASFRCASFRAFEGLTDPWYAWRFGWIVSAPRRVNSKGGMALTTFLLCGKMRAIIRSLKLASTVIWIIGITLEVLLFVRVAKANLLRHYKLFGFYLGFVLIRDLWLLTVFFLWPKFYPYAYWSTEPLGVIAGCGVVWEVYKVSLARYPGTARMARNVLAFLFILASSRIFVKALNSPTWIAGLTGYELERDLRIVQLALLTGLLVLFASYAIPFGRNIKGLTYGYCLFLVTSVANLTVRHHLGYSFERTWEYLQPISYLLVLSVWCVTLWSYVPIPEPKTKPRVEADYESLVAATKSRLRAARSSLLKATRP